VHDVLDGPARHFRRLRGMANRDQCCRNEVGWRRDWARHCVIVEGTDPDGAQPSRVRSQLCICGCDGKLVEVHQRYLDRTGRSEFNAERNVLDFLDWDSPEEEKFADDVRIVLASADFSREVTTTVTWLNERDLDIRGVRLRPYKLGDRILLDVQQIIPLPELTEYQVRLREKATERRLSRRQGAGRDFTRYDLECDGKRYVSQAKRHMIFEVARSAIARGAKPNELPLPARKWLSVEGRITTQEEIRVEARGERERSDLRTQSLVQRHGPPHDGRRSDLLPVEPVGLIDAANHRANWDDLPRAPQSGRATLVASD
jgi:hypothetical protein